MIAAAPASAPLVEQRPLPPSDRDFEVYRRSAVEGRTTREVAAEFNISQTRVMQLRTKVFEWIGTHLPPLARLSPEERLRVAETLACEQLQHQYDEAIGAWRASAGAVQVTRYVGRDLEQGVTVLKDSQGDPRYLRLATQISKAIARQKMAVMPNPETAVPIAAVDCGAAAAPLSEVDGEGGRESFSADLGAVGEVELPKKSPDPDHPLGDCSNGPAMEAAAKQSAASGEAVKAAAISGSAERGERKLALPAAENDAQRTVQAVLEGLENVPQKTRKERRREARMRRELFGERPAGRLPASLAASPTS